MVSAIGSLRINSKFLTHIRQYGISISIILLGLLRLVNVDFDLHRLFSVGDYNPQELSFKILAFCLVLLCILCLESRVTQNSEIWKLTPFLFRRIVSTRLLITLFSFLVFAPLLARLYSPSLGASLYNLFGVNAIFPYFADLNLVLNALTCPSVSKIGDLVTCGAGGAVYQYPASILMFSIDSNLLDLLTMIFGILQAIMLVTLLIMTSARKEFWVSLPSLVLAFSPQVQLLLERGNLDIAVLCLSALAIYYVMQNQAKLIVAFIFLSIATILKFYTFPAMIIVSIIAIKNRNNYLYLLISCSLGLTLLRDVILSSRYGISELRGSFGFINLLSFSVGNNSTDSTFATFSVSHLLSIFLVLFCLICGFLSARKNSAQNLVKSDGTVISSIIFISMVIFTNSYHYKLVFLVLTVSCYFLEYSKQGRYFDFGLFKILSLTVLSLLAFKETFFLPTNVIVIFLCGHFLGILSQKLTSRPAFKS